LARRKRRRRPRGFIVAFRTSTAAAPRQLHHTSHADKAVRHACACVGCGVCAQVWVCARSLCRGRREQAVSMTRKSENKKARGEDARVFPRVQTPGREECVARASALRARVCVIGHRAPERVWPERRKECDQRVLSPLAQPHENVSLLTRPARSIPHRSHPHFLPPFFPFSGFL